MNNVTTTNNNLNEMDQFLNSHDLPEFTQKEKYNLNRTLSIKGTESILIKPSKIQSTRPDKFTGEFYQAVKGGITSNSSESLSEERK